MNYYATYVLPKWALNEVHVWFIEVQLSLQQESIVLVKLSFPQERVKIPTLQTHHHFLQLNTTSLKCFQMGFQSSSFSVCLLLGTS